MILLSSRQARRAFCVICCIASLGVASRAAATLLRQAAPPAQDSAKKSSEQGPPVRIPRQRAQTSAALDGVVRDASVPGAARPVSAAVLTVRNAESGQTFTAPASVPSSFPTFPLPPGHYPLRPEPQPYAPFELSDLALELNEVVTLEI